MEGWYFRKAQLTLAAMLVCLELYSVSMAYSHSVLLRSRVASVGHQIAFDEKRGESQPCAER